MAEHTVKAFTEELDALTQEVARMGGLAETAVADSLAAVGRRDTELAQTVIHRDGKVLWRAPLDGYPSSNVVTYSVGGTQYVAVVTGMRNYHIDALARGYRDFRRARRIFLRNRR